MVSSVSTAGAADIREHEGYAKKLPDGGVKAYPDPATGKEPWTIGFGSTGPDIGPGTVWTRAQAEARFAADLIKFAKRAATLIGDTPTSQGQFDAMVSLAYNIGLANFSSSTLLRMHKARDYAGARQQFARWNKADGKVMDGLTARRAAEAKRYGG
jgi:lysozyme